jgi:hypothetical protein
MKTKKSFYINVTKEIIESSKQRHSGQCMIAQVLRQNYGASSVNVTAEVASFNKGGVRYTCTVPAVAALNLKQFDENKNAVKPFTFQLANPATRPVTVRTQKPKSKHKKISKKSSPRRCKRRYHGLQVIEAPKAA